MMAKRKEAATIFDERGRAVSVDSPYGRRFRDMMVASDQVGRTARERLSWLVRFTREDPATWHAGTRAAYGDCILALTGFGLPPTCLGGVQLHPPIPPEDVDEVQREVARVLQQLVTAPVLESVPLPDAGVSVELLRLTEKGARPAQWGRRYRFSSPLGVLHVLRDLVTEAGDRLVACRWCGSPIITTKKREFCNPACAQKYRNDKKARKADTKGKAR